MLHGETTIVPVTHFQFLFHQVRITTVRPKAMWIQSFPKAFTHDQHLGIEPQTPRSQVQRINYATCSIKERNLLAVEPTKGIIEY